MSEEELIKKKISTLKLQFSSTTAILAVDDEVIIENLLKIDENFNIFRKFFEILKTSSIEKVFLVNLDMTSEFQNEFHREISKINTKFEVKNVIFDENTTKNVVISIINKCNQLNGVFMRGFIMEKDNFHNKYFYETELIRTETVPLAENINNLKKKFSNYALDTQTFAEFLKNFAENNPIGAKCFIETPFGKKRTEKVMRGLPNSAFFDDDIDYLFCRSNPEESVFPEKTWWSRTPGTKTVKYRPFGVYCSVEKCDEDFDTRSQSSLTDSISQMTLETKSSHLEDYLKNEEIVDELKIEAIGKQKNWNDLPVEMKRKCIGSMTLKAKAMLSSCSKWDRNIVLNEKSGLKLLWIKEEITSSTVSHPNRYGRLISTPRTTFEVSLYANEFSDEAVLQSHLKYWISRCHQMSQKKEALLKKFESKHEGICMFVMRHIRRSEISHLKMELSEKSALLKTIANPRYGFPKNVHFLELKCPNFDDDGFKLAVRWNTHTLHLFGVEISLFNGVANVLILMVKRNFEIGRKIKLTWSYRQPSLERGIFGDLLHLNQLCEHLEATLIGNKEKYVRLAMKDENKHIVILNCSNNSVQLAVISKDLAEIPESFF